jgi:hypothetical protein
MPDASLTFVHRVPIATTALAVAFLVVLLRRAKARRWAPHLVWWGIGVFFYGLGTALESTITIVGNTATLTRLWYWAGAILGGYPLATGSVYLLMRRRLAHVLTAASLLVVLIASIAVMLTPIDVSAIEMHRPSGALIEWPWIRLMTPVINLYAAVFLVGGALWSAIRFAMSGGDGPRAIGTALIAVGGLLPGVGGAMAKAGLIEALYVGEFFGLILIWGGYEVCVRAPAPTAVLQFDPATPAAPLDAQQDLSQRRRGRRPANALRESAGDGGSP